MSLVPPARRFQALRPLRQSGGMLIGDAVDRERKSARTRLVVLSGVGTAQEALARFGRSERLAIGMQGLLRPIAVFEAGEALLQSLEWSSEHAASVVLAYDAPGPTL